MNTEYEYALGQNIRTHDLTRGLPQATLPPQPQTGGCDIPRGALAKMEVVELHISPYELNLLHERLEVS